MNLVFAFGMNLDPEFMRGCHAVGPATLRDWELEFRLYANVRPAPGKRVWGALWEVDAQGLARLDQREGYRGEGNKDNFYDRLTVKVDNGDEQVDALVYAMRDVRDELYPPSYYYLETILRGYKHFGLPDDKVWPAVRKACRNEAEYNELRQLATRSIREEAEEHA